MARNLYVSVSRLKGELDSVNTSWTAAETTMLEELAEAVSRKIDRECGFPLRQFYQSSANTARYFTSDDGAELVIPDLVSIDTNGLTTDADGDRTYETTWATTDYDLEPFNASEYDEPYTYIHVTPTGRYSFPTHAKGVKITGTWGWPAVPRETSGACMLESKRAWQQAQSPSGVISSDELGRFMIEPELHPKTLALIGTLRRGFLVGAS